MTGCGINHGAYGGYQKPRKLGVEECTECRDAQVWYARRRRESGGECWTLDGSDYGDEGSTA